MFSLYAAGPEQQSTGEWLHSHHTSYQVLSLLGYGSFGHVVKCTRMDNQKTVAVKMIRDQCGYKEQAREEIAALHKIKSLDSDKCNIVKWNEAFLDRGYICLEFEHLDKNLFDFLKERQFRPLHLEEIRPIVHQLATALEHLKAAGIIHTDLKLENVMLVDHIQRPFRVKVIDFGLACETSAAQVGAHIQTRPYRSPEIILGLPFTEAIDMWSLGCIAACLYLGDFLYPGVNEYDMIRYIVETHGLPPESLLSSGLKTHWFFQRFCSRTNIVWKLKPPEQFSKETGIESLETRRFQLSSLDDLLHFSSVDKAVGAADVAMFVDMLKGMLQLEAFKRFTPRQVLQHHFTTMCHWRNFCPAESHRAVPCPHCERTVCSQGQQTSVAQQLQMRNLHHDVTPSSSHVHPAPKPWAPQDICELCKQGGRGHGLVWILAVPFYYNPSVWHFNQNYFLNSVLNLYFQVQ